MNTTFAALALSLASPAAPQAEVPAEAPKMECCCKDRPMACCEKHGRSGEDEHSGHAEDKERR